MHRPQTCNTPKPVTHSEVKGNKLEVYVLRWHPYHPAGFHRWHPVLLQLGPERLWLALRMQGAKFWLSGREKQEKKSKTTTAQTRLARNAA